MIPGPEGADPRSQPRWGWEGVAGSAVRRLKPAATHGWPLPGPDHNGLTWRLWDRGGRQLMKKMVLKILVLGLLMGIGPIPVKTETSIRFRDSGRTLRSFPGHTPTHHNMLALLSGQPDAPDLPEPLSMILFGSGLMLLGGVLRRRKAAPPQAQPDTSRTVTPLFAH